MKNKIKLNTIGSDPEISIVNQGHIVPAGKLMEQFGVDKLIDREYDDEGQVSKGYHLIINEDAQVYEDGMSWEFNMRPSDSIEVMIQRFSDLLRASQHLCNIFGYQLAIEPMIQVTQQDVDEGGVVCARFGCDPDDSIYDDKFNPANVDARNHLARYFGCHIHSGMTDYMVKKGGLSWVMSNMSDVITSYDLLVGLPNVIIGTSLQSLLRRKVYGRAGRHRLQIPYGFEYRTPDNYIMRSPQLLGAFFHLARVATFLSQDHELVETALNRVGGKNTLFNAITLCDRDGAYNMFAEVRNLVEQLSSKLTVDRYGAQAMDLVMTKDVGINTDFMKAWDL